MYELIQRFTLKTLLWNFTTNSTQINSTENQAVESFIMKRFYRDSWMNVHFIISISQNLLNKLQSSLRNLNRVSYIQYNTHS